jgi:hypothetical protein
MCLFYLALGTGSASACTDICDTCIDFWVSTKWPWILYTQPHASFGVGFGAEAHDDEGSPCHSGCYWINASVEGWCWQESTGTGPIYDLDWNGGTGYSPADCWAWCYFDEPGTYYVDVYSWDDDGQADTDYVQVNVADVAVSMGRNDQDIHTCSLSISLPTQIQDYLQNTLQPAANAYMNAAQAFYAAYQKTSPEIPGAEYNACTQAKDNLIEAYNGYVALLNSTVITPGEADVTMTPGQFWFSVEETHGWTEANVGIRIELEVAGWYSTRNSFGPEGYLWSGCSPSVFSLGSATTVRVDKNGNAGKIRVIVNAGYPTAIWKTITREVDIPIIDGATEETLKTQVYSFAADGKNFAEAVDANWEAVNNGVDGANGALQLIPVIGDEIAGAVNIVRALSQILHDQVVAQMHDNVKATFAIQRNEVEKEYEKLQPGLLEDDDAATDIAMFNALY